MRREEIEKLKKLVEKYRTIIETSMNGIYQIDTLGKFIFVNKTFAEMFGYRHEELIGKNYTILLPFKSISQVKKWVKEVFSGKSVENEVNVKHKDGHEFIVYFSAVPMKKEGKIVGLSGNLIDITERKKTEEELKESEERYRDLIEKEKDIIYTLDDKGNITFVSPTVETILGYRPEEVMGKNFMVLIPKEWQKKTLADFNNLLKTGEITAETVLLDKKGQSHPVEYSSTVIREGNKVVGTRGIVRDITDRKKIEEVLRKAKDDLQSKVEELERFSKLAVGRELKMIELKNRINELEEKLRNK